MSVVKNISWFQKNPKKTICCILIGFYMISDLLMGALLLPDIEGEPHHYYHHALKKNYHGFLKWGVLSYEIYTNSLGFKDSKIQQIALSDKRHRILIIGDSFGEGIGMPYEKTFVGLVEKKFDPSKVSILNASVKSYSPKLYYLKTKYLIERVGLHFDELFVYIDISDISDELFEESFLPSHRFSYATIARNINGLLSNNFYIYNKFGESFLRKAKYKSLTIVRKALNWNNQKDGLLNLGSPIGNGVKKVSLDIPDSENNHIDMDKFDERYYQDRAKWTSDKVIYQTWGKKGLRMAEEHMKKLVSLCNEHDIRMTIAVYPWPLQIMNSEIDSIQVTFWESFAEKYNIGFIDYFPDFINSSSPGEIINRYFIQGDDHWNEKGHELIANKLSRSIRHKANREIRKNLKQADKQDMQETVYPRK